MRQSGDIFKLLLIWAAFGFALFFTGTDSLWVGPSLIAVLALGVAVLVPGVKAGWVVPRSGVVWLVAFFWGSLFLTLPWSTSYFTSFLFALILSVLPFLFFVFCLSQNPEVETRRAGLAILAALAVIALGAVVQFLFLKQGPGDRIHFPLHDPNNLSTLMNMGLIPAAALFVTGRYGRRKLFAALTALFWAALLATESRSGLFSALASLAVLLALTGRPFSGRRRELLALTAILVLLPVLMKGWSLLYYASGSGLKYDFLFAGQASITDRLSLWGSTLAMAVSRPWTGYGLGTFYYNYPRWRSPVDVSNGYFTHMDPLQMWAEAGVLVPLLFYAVLVAVLVRTALSLKKTAPGDAGRIDVAAGFCAMLAVALQAHVNFTLYLPSILIPLACLLARWHTATGAILGDGHKKIKSPPAFAVVCLLLALTAFWLVRAAAGAYFISGAAACVSHNDDACMERQIGLARVFSPGSNYAVAQYEARLSTLRLLVHGGTLGQAEKTHLIEDGIAAIARAQTLNPAYGCMKTDHAMFYIFAQRNGDRQDGYDKAAELLAQAIHDDPLCLTARQPLAAIYDAKGRHQEALEVMVSGLPWPRPRCKPDINYLLTTAKLSLRMGEQDRYRKLIDEAGRQAAACGLTDSFSASVPSAQ